jgi:hypothetical protein
MADVVERMLQPGLDAAQIMGLLPVGEPKVFSRCHASMLYSMQLSRCSCAVGETNPIRTGLVSLTVEAVDLLAVAAMSAATITRKYRELAALVHPDKTNGSGQAANGHSHFSFRIRN